MRKDRYFYRTMVHKTYVDQSSKYYQQEYWDIVLSRFEIFSHGVA